MLSWKRKVIQIKILFARYQIQSSTPTPKIVRHVQPGPHLNIKTVLSTYGDFHVKDKTAARTSYL